ncbi:MAG: hypothetical protein QGI46_11395 [Planctomycetota bacterium]|nr:hypothetical protein [Planctomycetota bacterium]
MISPVLTAILAASAFQGLADRAPVTVGRFREHVVRELTEAAAVPTPPENAVARHGELTARAGRDGLWLCAGDEEPSRLFPTDGVRRWAPAEVGAVHFDALGRLWFGSAQGLGRLAEDGWRLWTGADGLPHAGATCLSSEPDGTLWIGTERGVLRFDGEHFEVRRGRRWLPDDRVNAIAADGDGAWIWTRGGVARIDLEPTTLGAKARFFEAEIDRRHRRTPFGFVHSVHCPQPGDATGAVQTDSDNDGLWTSMYGTGECFAFAATESTDARRRARAAFEALRFLGDVTQGGEHPAPPGFIARTILPASGPDPNEGRLERDRRTRDTEDARWKLLDPRWPLSADGEWYWKGDTSSDELDGHYFFYPRYFDLVCRTDEERAEVVAVVRRLTDHMIDHGFRLVDHDGLPTRWGHFAPADLNDDRDWWEERGLNSLSMLSYLKVAEHVTGEDRYREVARTLIDEHGYAANALWPKFHAGPGSGNQSDDEMAIMGLYNLVLYEDDPELRQIYLRSARRYHRLVAPERNPLFHFLFVGALREGDAWEDSWGSDPIQPQPDWLADSIDTLRRFPRDRFTWGFVNSDRLDVVLLPDWLRLGRSGGKRGTRRDGKVLPIDERFVGYWNHDSWRLDSGGDGRGLYDGASYLLPYYAGLHHGFLAVEDAGEPSAPR